MAKHDLGEYKECSICGNYFKLDYMAYIKPNVEMDVFNKIDSMCNRCVKNKLEKITQLMLIPNSRKRDVRWISKNIFSRCPTDNRVETVLFLCSITLDN